MKALVVGLGSMGKRRIRCLQALGVKDITGFDKREDRIAEAVSKYNIAITRTLDEKTMAEYDCAVISTPPDWHFLYMEMATKAKTHFFVEAGVMREGLLDLERMAKEAGIVAAPSTTLSYFSAIQKVMEIVQSGKIGKISNFIYHSGQYLPDWHTYEHVSEYYVSNPLTGATREIVPFELTWLCKCFGWPKSVSARTEKTINIEGAEKIDDTYSLLLEFPTHPGVLVVDVVARAATRTLSVMGTEGQIHWNWNDPAISVYDPTMKEWTKVAYPKGKAAEGYNVNIAEGMYIDEVGDFLAACQSKKAFPNTLSEDVRVLDILYGAEESHRSGKRVSFL